MKITGYAYIDEHGAINPQTVAATEIAAMVNTLMAIRRWAVTKNWGDDTVRAVFADTFAGKGRIALVEICECGATTVWTDQMKSAAMADAQKVVELTAGLKEAIKLLAEGPVIRFHRSSDVHPSDRPKVDQYQAEVEIWLSKIHRFVGKHAPEKLS